MTVLCQLCLNGISYINPSCRNNKLSNPAICFSNFSPSITPWIILLMRSTFKSYSSTYDNEAFVVQQLSTISILSDTELIGFDNWFWGSLVWKFCYLISKFNLSSYSHMLKWWLVVNSSWLRDCFQMRCSRSNIETEFLNKFGHLQCPVLYKLHVMNDNSCTNLGCSLP